MYIIVNLSIMAVLASEFIGRYSRSVFSMSVRNLVSINRVLKCQTTLFVDCFSYHSDKTVASFYRYVQF